MISTLNMSDSLRRGLRGVSACLSFTLPIQGNEDRRRKSDRRSVRGERRRRGGEEQGEGEVDRV